MESAKPSSSAPPYSGGAGAGGKFRKPPVSRKRPSTPYDRPPVATGNNKSDESQDGGGGWLSKLVVNPARRLIVGGATRILPSFFSKSDSSSADEYEDDLPSDHDDQDTDATGTGNACGDAKHTLELGVSRWSGGAGPSNEMDKLKNSSEHNIVQQDESKNSPNNLGLVKIENLLKGKQFSRDERNRLMEILNSRLVDVSHPEGDKITQTMNFNEKAKVDKRVEPETPMPRLQSNMEDEVGASPIDIARAYMGNRPSELGFNTYNIMSKDGKDQQNLDLISSKPHFLTPSSKSSTCWPGAMVQDQRGYLTPQTQRSRYGLHNFPRTPYSRTIYSKTNPKINTLQADRKSSHSPLTTFQQSRNPNYGQMKSSDGGYGSVGPIRRVRNKIVSEPRTEGPSNLSYGEITSSPFVSRSFVPVFQKNQETGGTRKQEQSFKREGSPNETVRKIMEKLDRHKPTPKEKAEELKLASEWKRSSFLPKESTILGKSDDTSFVKRKDGGVSFKEMANPMTTKTSISSVDDAGAGPSFGFKNVTGANEKSTFTNIKEKEKSQPWSVDYNQINGQDLTKKPILKPISFTRPDPKQVVSSDNREFAFPFSANATSASEPPTPSILPSFPATTVIPNYTFGTKKSGERLVFSFPSTSSGGGGPIDDGESDLKFNFGSDKKRVSFGSIGSDAIAIN